MITYKIKSGALQFAILIGVIVAIILSAFLMLNYTQQSLNLLIQSGSNARSICHLGINYALLRDLNYETVTFPTIRDVEPEALSLVKSHWGIYDKIISNVELKNKAYQKIALVGGHFIDGDRPAIYLEDTNTPLVLVGSTLITGKAIVSDKGIKAGNIAGQYFRGDRLIHGATDLSAGRLPTIQIEKVKYLESLIYKPPSFHDSLIIDHQRVKIERSFNSNPSLLYRSDPIILSDYYHGNLIVKSDQRIDVTALADINNAILIAPEIHIQTGFKGSLQALASEQIVLAQETQLDYPSALVLIDKGDQTRNKHTTSEIRLESGSRLAGSIVFLSHVEKSRLKPKIHIADNALVLGELYCEDSVELYGKVQGSVYTHTFASQQRGSIYQNHIYNGHINSHDLPKSFCGIHTKLTQSNIAAWLY